MKITVVGAGYVGLVTGACLAEAGNEVVLVDVDEERVARLRNGEIPIHEPGLDALVESSAKAGRLAFTSSLAEGTRLGRVIFIAVGTPSQGDGEANISAVLEVAEGIARHMDGYRLIATKSTVPVGTTHQVQEIVGKTLLARGVDFSFDVASNPEFLKEGQALEDFLRPDRIVVGAEHPRAVAFMRDIYAPFQRSHERLLVMDVRSAELTKYAANAMLATRISFMNELALLAEKLGADIEAVRQGIGSDPRIGYAFLYPGAGFGGSCLPKDLRALLQTAESNGCELKVTRAAWEANERQKKVLFEKIVKRFGQDLSGHSLAIWGLAFKPNTDDLREAPALFLCNALIEAGAKVRAHDPVAMDQARKIYAGKKNISFFSSPYEALEGAQALAVVTEWQLYRSPDFEEIARKLNSPVIFDGRNLYDPKRLAALGIEHHGIGRGVA